MGLLDIGDACCLNGFTAVQKTEPGRSSSLEVTCPGPNGDAGSGHPYFEIVPSNTLETILWAEADRMKGLAIDASNVKNLGFAWQYDLGSPLRGQEATPVIVDGILYLERASFVTGETLHIDGGQTAGR